MPEIIQFTDYPYLQVQITRFKGVLEIIPHYRGSISSNERKPVIAVRPSNDEDYKTALETINGHRGVIGIRTTPQERTQGLQTLLVHGESKKLVLTNPTFTLSVRKP